MQQISYKKTETGWQSDPVTAESSTLVIRVEFETAGASVLERSITGEGFVPENVFSTSDSRHKTVERNVSGCVAGQQLRLTFFGSKPEKIYVLQ
ncbi:MAG: hypothetical protein ACI30I_08990 [Parabacteroides sp.]